MNSENGGHNSSDLQRQAAAAIARKRVLAAYAKSADEARKEASKNKAHLKNEPSRLDSESWKKYHSAWQNYYQKYYNDYYSRAAQNYIARERLKNERERAEEEEILTKIAKSSIKTNKTNGLTLGTDNDITSQDSTIKDNLRQKIRKKATENAKFSHRHRHLIPIIAGIVVVLIILFLQYNRLIFAPIMAYVSPGNSPASEIEAIDPTITQTISPEPRLIIPKLNIDVPVHFGVQLSDVMASMNNGVAHYRIAGASAYPGEIGNLVITGHSAGDIYSSNPYKYIFSGLERLNDGDLIYINYNSVRYTYRVTKKEVVEPTNVAALVVNTDKPILTLVTCTPLGTSRYRLLVTAEQISPNPDTAESSKNPVTVDQNLDQEMPSNEPSFFEGIWNWLTGN